jgi:hypothetical protein
MERVEQRVRDGIERVELSVRKGRPATHRVSTHVARPAATPRLSARAKPHASRAHRPAVAKKTRRK